MAEVCMTLHYPMHEPLSQENLEENSNRPLAIKTEHSELTCPKHIFSAQLKKAIDLKIVKI